MRTLVMLVMSLSLVAPVRAAQQYALFRVVASTGSGTYHAFRKMVGRPYESYDSCMLAGDATRARDRYKPGVSIAYECRRR